MLLLLPPSVGSGGKRRLLQPALLHEPNLEEDPQKEVRQEEQEIEKRWKVGGRERLQVMYQRMVQAHVALNTLPNVI